METPNADGGGIAVPGNTEETEWTSACVIRLGAPYRVQVECIKYVSIGDGI